MADLENEERDHGMHYTYLFIGMSGEQFVDKMNANLEATDIKFSEQDIALSLRIISNEIKEIKVEDGKTYYTLETPDVQDRTWYSLQGEWGKIGGNIEDQVDLRNALNSKANQTDYLALERTVDANYLELQNLEDAFTLVSNTVNSLDNAVNGTTGILVRLNNVEDTLATKITSNQVLEIRCTDGLSLEFTTDGRTWKPVSTAGVVDWGDIIGDINNQADLLLLFDDVDDAISAVDTALTNHKNDHNNPHQVTAAQVGLGNVDNTSDSDKPLSTAQKTYVDNEIADLKTELETEFAGALTIVNCTQAQYEAITTKDPNTLYLINNL